MITFPLGKEINQEYLVVSASVAVIYSCIFSEAHQVWSNILEIFLGLDLSNLENV